MTLQIGSWVRRKGGKYHIVESIVAGDAVTKCGRRLRDEVELQVSDVMPLTRAIGQPQLFLDKTHRSAGCTAVFRISKSTGGLCQCCNHQPVPVSEYLVIPARARTLLPSSE